MDVASRKGKNGEESAMEKAVLLSLLKTSFREREV
jgi:hypothetical protein